MKLSLWTTISNAICLKPVVDKYMYIHCTRTDKKKNRNKYKKQLQKIEKEVGMKYQKACKQ